MGEWKKEVVASTNGCDNSPLLLIYYMDEVYKKIADSIIDQVIDTCVAFEIDQHERFILESEIVAIIREELEK